MTAIGSFEVTAVDANRRPIGDFVLENNTNLDSSSHCFQDITYYRAKFCCQEGLPLFITAVCGATLNSGL